MSTPASLPVPDAALPPGASEYDEVFFLGDHTASFALRAPAIAAKLDTFAGVIVGRPSEAKHERLTQWLRPQGSLQTVALRDWASRTGTRRTLVVDFNETLAGLQFRHLLRAAGTPVVDYLRLLHDLDLCHTYQTVREERAITLANLHHYARLMDRLCDPLSQQTLAARAHSWASLDREPLLRVSQPFGLFSRHPVVHGSSLHIGEEEHYVDVGAAHGDTAAEFYNASLGRYGSMAAFEPDPVNFQALELVCSAFPRASAYAMGLSDAPGSLEFLEQAHNRHGSHFLQPGGSSESAAGAVRRVPVQPLDACIERSTVMKIDVEGFECAVLRGAQQRIRQDRPSLHVSGYHYAADLWQIVDTLDGIHRYAHAAVRHYGHSLYDTNLLFSDRQRFV